MPRTYIKKRTISYSPDNLIKAVNDVINKKRSYRQAQEYYGVPLSVIYNRIKGRKVPIERIGAGRPTALPLSVEQQIANCLIARSQMGYPCDKSELKALVTEYIQVNNIKTPFKDGIPGEDWYLAFMKRNKQLSLKKAEHLQTSRKNARDPSVIYDFYEKLENLYKQYDLNTIEKSKFVYNCDESGFGSDPSKLRGIGEKGKNLTRVSGGSGRESTTVLLCICADGSFLPPLIVFKGAAVQARWVSDKSYPGTQFAASSNGWMEEPHFYSWFKDVFILHIKSIREKYHFPDQTALLLYDGHSSHISVRIIEEALNNNIQLFRLPSHLTDKLQPLDKCVFGPVKIKWDKQLVEYGKKRMGTSSTRLTKDNFSVLLGTVLKDAVTLNNVKNGFSTTGIFPLNSAKFPEDLFDPIDLKRYRANKKRLEVFKNESKSPDSEIELDIPRLIVNPPDTVNATPKKGLNTEKVFSQNTHMEGDMEDVPLDLSLRKDNPSPQKSILSPKNIVEIFSNSIKTNEHTVAVKEKTTRRLKQMNYGEVLTATNVLERLKECEKKKIPKRKKNAEVNDTKPKRKKVNDTTKKINTVQEVKGNSTEVQYTKPELQHLIPGSYILIDFISKDKNKATYKYVCVINSIAQDECTVTGMKSINNEKTSFVVVENDIFSINLSSIKAILPAPSVKYNERKLVYTFPGFVSVKEK